ncbi:ABC transporter permease [Natronosalvus halobius]|uniref:ABC transporter permease n=1 Tax=Natronosalvus halobius TaxID=2953746 RepID=UPI0020A1B160|nr:ABC transporter permease [Natronosalvus halobius]USZ72979.1 ABC transporter permease [Natronosalvus halobius]
MSSATGYVGLTRAIFEKQLILLRRYWINTTMMLVGFYLFFAVIFFGGQAAAGPAFDGTLDGLVVGFFLFLAVTAAYFDVAGNVMREAQWGTLEQLFMSPFGIGRVLLAKTLFNVVFSTAIAMALLAIMLLTTDRTLTVDPLTIVPLVLVTILPAIGLGFLFAGLSLLYKRIENVQQLLQFAFIGLIAAPGALDSSALLVVPFSLGSDLLYRAMVDGVALWSMPGFELVALALNGVAYLLAGFAVFHLLVRRARRLGVMGHY